MPMVLYNYHCVAVGTNRKPFKGNFNVRIPTDLHRKAALLALDEKVWLNVIVADSIRSRVEKYPGV